MSHSPHDHPEVYLFASAFYDKGRDDQQDYYGYEISTLIREQTDGYLNIPVGSLYPALYKLIDAGYISDYKKQVGRRQVNVYYHLEDSGRTHLQQLLEDYYATANAIQQVLKYTVTQEEEGGDNDQG